MFERFYEARKGNGLAFGTHCWMTDLGPYEMCGKLGYDYVWIDNEHGGMTFPMIGNGIIAANAGGSAAIVRIPGHAWEDVKPVLEFGSQGIVFPMVNTPEQAEMCAKHCKYPPRGTRGCGPLRAAEYGARPLLECLPEIDERTLCFVQCEHIESVRNLDAILEVPDVDVIICGPMDLSFSLGKPGQFDDPEVMEAIDTIIRKCKEKKKSFGVSTGMGAWEMAKYFIKNGANFVSAGNMYDGFVRLSNDLMDEVKPFR